MIQLNNIYSIDFIDKTHYFMKELKLNCDLCHKKLQYCFFLFYHYYLNEKVEKICINCYNENRLKEGQIFKINFVDEIPNDSKKLLLKEPELQKSKEITIYDIHKLDCKRTIDKCKYKYESFEDLKIGLSEEEIHKIDNKRLKELE
jgi:hypothetical protein